VTIFWTHLRGEVVNDYDDVTGEYDALTVTFENKSNTVMFRKGSDPRNLIENRITELHSLALCMWIFYYFSVVLTGAIAGHLFGSGLGILVLFGLGGLTYRLILRKSDQMFGLIEEWQFVLQGKPSPSIPSQMTRQDRLGPPIEWID